MKLLLFALLAGALVLAAGCGGGDDPGGSANPADIDIDDGKRGGDVVFLARGDIDFADPGLTYYTFGFMVQNAVNRSLYSYRPDSDIPVPDLAAGEPQISEDDRTITVRLKPDVRYAPPLGDVVTSADVKYAIERSFTTNVRSNYAASYFGEIEGAPPRPVPIEDLESFPGLETPNDYTLVIKLTKPVAQRVAAALTLPITVPVPKGYAGPFDKRSPSSYEDHVAFSGPYMIRNDKRTGRLVGRVDGKRIELVRNPNWDEATDHRPAYLDTITIEEGGKDLAQIFNRTLSGERVLCCDSLKGLDPPLLERALERFDTQVGSVSGGGTRWVALNTTVEPLDNLNVRKAIIAAFDRTALRDTLGGEDAGPVAQGYLPPGIPGFDDSGGEEGFDDLDWMQAPEGDLELARKYMLAARADGVPVTPDGMYDGPDKLLTIATDAESGLATAQVARAEFAKLGFELDLRRVPEDTLFSEYCGSVRKDVAVCPNAAWFKDFADPEEMLRPTFSGAEIPEEPNTNWSELDDEGVDKAMDAAAPATGTDRARLWADVNRAVVEQAPGVPYLWDTAYQVASADLNAVMSSFSATWDLNFVSVK